MKATTKTTIPENYTARIIALGLLATCLLLMFTGCQHESAKSTALSAPDVAGTYALVSIDGQPVPCVIHHEGTDMNVKSGSFTFTADGRCSTRTVIAVKGAAKDAIIARNATYQQSGKECVMRWSGFGQTKGELNGNEFTMNNEGMVFAYRK